MRSLITSRWFALADLACAVTASAWWVFAHPAGAWPLIIALAPWGLHVAAGKFPVQRSPFNFPIVVFLLTAGVGVWAAYDRAAAWNKFWLLVAGVVLYYALAEQPSSNGGFVACLAGVLGASLGVYFLLTNNWEQSPADLSLLNRLGTAWMSIRPDVHQPIVQPNIAGGLLAMLLPINLPWMIHAWQRRNRWLLLAATGLSAVLAISLLMTSSRAACVALIVGLGIWCWWYISGLVARRFNWGKIPTFGLPVFLVSLLALGAFGLRTSSLIQVANTVPGEADAGSRVEITRNTIQLIRDYPFTGGGLASFPGLYSTYIRVIQVPEFFYSHNLYIDITLEQGLPGLAAFLFLMAGSILILLHSLAADPLRNYLAGASLTGLTVVLLHGFLDDALYGMGGTPLLFLIPGLATSLGLTTDTGTLEPKSSVLTHRKRSSTARGWALGSTLTLLGLGGAGLVYAKPLASTWYANMGAVAMSRIQLFVWPDSFPGTQITQARIEPGIDLFYKALDQNPNNSTALYRSGIYAYMRKDFEQAKDYLESSYAHNRSHQGIRKLLGYTYIWTGDMLKAKVLLIKIPEAGEELGSYSWWWVTQNRPDLAELASQMAAQLQRH